jgi:hypothetical protein
MVPKLIFISFENGFGYALISLSDAVTSVTFRFVVDHLKIVPVAGLVVIVLQLVPYIAFVNPAFKHQKSVVEELLIPIDA